MSNIWTMKIRSPVTTTNQLFNEDSVIMWFWFGLPNDDDINNIFHQLRIKNLTEIKKLSLFIILYIPTLFAILQLISASRQSWTWQTLQLIRLKCNFDVNSWS